MGRPAPCRSANVEKAVHASCYKAGAPSGHGAAWNVLAGRGLPLLVRAQARDAPLNRAMQCWGWLNFHATLSGENAGIKFDSNRYGRIDFTITPIGVTHVTTTNYLFS